MGPFLTLVGKMYFTQHYTSFMPSADAIDLRAARRRAYDRCCAQERADNIAYLKGLLTRPWAFVTSHLPLVMSCNDPIFQDAKEPITGLARQTIQTKQIPCK
jgi:hypothetical protein